MIELQPDELEIEENAEKLVPVSEEKRAIIDSKLDTVRKNRAISLRMTNFDLQKIKERAEKEGIPYQTLINSILHKYVTNQLFEKDEILKSMRILKAL